MDIYHKWKELLDDEEKRNEWIEFYKRNDPTFSAAIDFCKNENRGMDEKRVLELAIIAILDSKVKLLSGRHMMAHCMSRPLPRKLKVGQPAYPEDTVDFDSAAIHPLG